MHLHLYSDELGEYYYLEAGQGDFVGCATTATGAVRCQGSRLFVNITTAPSAANQNSESTRYHNAPRLHLDSSPILSFMLRLILPYLPFLSL